MSNFLEISTAISTQLSTMVNDWSISWPNVEFDVEQGESYLRLSFIPASTEQADLGTNGMNVNLGIAQIDVFYSGQYGFGDAYQKADDVAEHFRRGTKLTSNGVEVAIESVEIGPNLNEAGYFQVPVSISYRSYTAN